MKFFQKKQQNLLIVTFDQLRADWSNPHTPIIDLPGISQIAKSGWMAQRCYTASPQCVPARFSWLTGLEPSQLRITRNESVDLPNDAPSIIRWIKNKGWQTEIIGKTHWTSHSEMVDLREKENVIKDLGFEEVIEVAGPRALKNIKCELTDEWETNGLRQLQIDDLKKRYGKGRSPESWKPRPSILPNDLYPDIWIANKGIERLKSLSAEKPWLLWISFVGPHEPFDTPSPWNEIEIKKIPRAEKNYKWIEELDPSCELSKHFKIWKGKLDEDSTLNLRRDYGQHIKLLDDKLSEIIRVCLSREDSERTGVLITSDHGEMLGDQGMLYKSTFLEPAIRVPFIYRQPGGCTTSVRYKKEIPLTAAFHEVIRGVTIGGSSKRLSKWADNRKQAVVIEFGSERAFIKDRRKVVVNENGDVIWATKLEGKRKEKVNFNQSEEIRGKDWRGLIKEAKLITRRRQKYSWLWRDLSPM